MGSGGSGWGGRRGLWVLLINALGAGRMVLGRSWGWNWATDLLASAFDV